MTRLPRYNVDDLYKLPYIKIKDAYALPGFNSKEFRNIYFLESIDFLIVVTNA